MEKYQIPSLNFRNYLFATQSTKKSPQKIPSDLSRKKQSSPKFNRSLFNGIFTVAESLNENYIIKTLQPDLGSLESFVNLKEKPNFENYRQSLKNMRCIGCFLSYLIFFVVGRLKKMINILKIQRICFLIKKGLEIKLLILLKFFSIFFNILP